MPEIMGGMKNYNSFAELVDSRTESVRRGQTMTKINEFGVGVIYNWEFQMSFSTNIYDKELLPPSEMGKQKESLKYKGQDTERYKARFMYVGLSVQLPTKARMDAHLKGKKDSKFLKDVFHTVLREAVQSEFNENQMFKSKRTLANPIAAAQIINVCSFFDLGLLESYYIQEGAVYAPLTGLKEFEQNFPGAMQGGSNSKVSGVNTAGGDQGGPTRQADMAKRGKIEWILAAYYAIYEAQQDVLNARTAHSNKYASLASSIRADKKSVDVKIFDFIQGILSLGKEMASDAILSFLKTINLQDIQKVVKIFGLGAVSKEGITGPMDAATYIKDKEILNFLEYVNLDLQQMQVLQFDAKTGISVQKRAEFVNKVLEAPLLNGNQSIINLKVDIKKALQELQIAPRFGGSIAVKVNEAKKLIQDQLINIAENQAEYKALGYTAQKFKDEQSKVVSNLKKQLKENFEITNVELDVYGANKDAINAMKDQKERSILKSLDEIENILEDVFGDATVKSSQLAMMAGAKPKNKK